MKAGPKLIDIEALREIRRFFDSGIERQAEIVAIVRESFAPQITHRHISLLLVSFSELRCPSSSAALSAL